MRIISLELENVKSYVRQQIDFTDGLNAICGLNGSGKSTVLESIGFALFDHLPYSQNAFRREGERSATVRVRLLAGDGREYEVVRRIGGGNAYYVSDMESGTRLAERTQNVVDWIRTQALRIDGAVDLSSLFKNAVGVPQGLITADFIQSSATARKSIFDPLLRVEEYRQAFEYLRETASYLAGLAGSVREEIARLEVETNAIPQLRERIDTLRDEMTRVERRRASVSAQLDGAEAKKKELDAALETCRQIGQDLRNAQNDEARIGEILGLETAALDQAIRAHAIARQTEPGFQAVLAARDTLRALQQESEIRNELRAQAATVTTQLSAISGRIDGLQSQWDAARGAAAEAALLHEPAVRQHELETELAGVMIQVDERDSLLKQATKMQEDVAQMQSARVALARRLQESEAAGTEIGRLESVRRELEARRDELAKIEPLRRQRDDLIVEGKRLRQMRDEIEADVERGRDLQRRADQKRFEAAPLESLLSRQDTLRQERAGVVATLDYQNVARGELHRHHCPLLGITCPAVETDVTLLDRFDGRVTELAAEAKRLERELLQLLPQVESAQQAAVEWHELEVRAAQLRAREPQRDSVQDDLERCRQQYANLTDRVNEEKKIAETCRQLTEEQARLQGMVEIAALLPELRDRQEQEDKRFEALSLELKRVESRCTQLHNIDEQRASLERALDVLGDPRRRRVDLSALAARLPQIDDERRDQEVLRGEQENTLESLVAQLGRFSNLDRDLEEQHRLEDVNRPDHDKFLEHREEAGRLEQRRAAVLKTTQDLETAHRNARTLGKHLEQADAAYDLQEHDRLLALCRSLGDDISAAHAQQAYLLNDLQTCERELVHLQRRHEKLLQQQAERDELGRLSVAISFIRETLKEAGPAITETLLANISQTANDIYAEIMNDHAADLRWTSEYEILVQRGAEERRFAQLSGGEQMSAALAVRLALLKEMSEIDFAFFDEPTQNMDGERRSNLAEQIRAVHGFQQLVVISHDDTFEHHTDNLIRLRKIHEQTELETV